MARRRDAPTILAAKQHDAPSVFLPENLLREARRQRGLADASGAGGLRARSRTATSSARCAPAAARGPRSDWACYHTEMDVTEHDGITIGIVGLAVGAPFAVLVAEQLFASGCRLLISVTSAGQIAPVGPTPYFVLIDRALRDEGTSHHYLPPSTVRRSGRAHWPTVRIAGARRAIDAGASRHGLDHRRTLSRNRGTPSPRRVHTARWRSRWRLRRSTRSPARAGATCCASRT